MNQINILLLDIQMSKAKTQKALCDIMDFVLFDFIDEFTKKIRSKDDLANEMTSYLNNAELIPTFVIEKFVHDTFRNFGVQKILLSGYPRTLEQYLSLETMFKSLNISIYSIYYIKQRNPKTFFDDYYNDPRHKQWLDKYGSKWLDDFMTQREMIDNIKRVSQYIKWHEVEMDYKADLKEEYIFQKIHDCCLHGFGSSGSDEQVLSN